MKVVRLTNESLRLLVEDEVRSLMVEAPGFTSAFKNFYQKNKSRVDKKIFKKLRDFFSKKTYEEIKEFLTKTFKVVVDAIKNVADEETVTYAFFGAMLLTLKAAPSMLVFYGATLSTLAITFIVLFIVLFLAISVHDMINIAQDGSKQQYSNYRNYGSNFYEKNYDPYDPGDTEGTVSWNDLVVNGTRKLKFTGSKTQTNLFMADLLKLSQKDCDFSPYTQDEIYDASCRKFYEGSYAKCIVYDANNSILVAFVAKPRVPYVVLCTNVAQTTLLATRASGWNDANIVKCIFKAGGGIKNFDNTVY